MPGLPFGIRLGHAHNAALHVLRYRVNMAESKPSGFDCYTVLGVQSTAGFGDIRSAYLKLARQNHPDRNMTFDEVGRQRTEERMKHITRAFQILSDPESRLRFDSQSGVDDDDDKDASDPSDIGLSWRRQHSEDFKNLLNVWKEEFKIESTRLAPDRRGQSDESTKLRIAVQRELDALPVFANSFDTSCARRSQHGTESPSRPSSACSGGNRPSYKAFLDCVVVETNKLPKCRTAGFLAELTGQTVVSGQASATTAEIRPGRSIPVTATATSMQQFSVGQTHGSPPYEHAQVSEVPTFKVRPPPAWIPDSDRRHCAACQRPFRVFMLRRRHHCRSCGKVFCKICTPHWVPLRHLGFTGPVRVCRECFGRRHIAPHEAWMQHAKNLFQERSEEDARTCLEVAIALRPEDAPSTILAAAKAMTETGCLGAALLWCVTHLTNKHVKLPQTIVMKIHKMIASTLYQLVSSPDIGRRVRRAQKRNILEIALDARCQMQEIATSEHVEVLDGMDSRIRDSISRLDTEVEKEKQKELQNSLDKLRRALRSYDLKAVTEALAHSRREAILTFMEDLLQVSPQAVLYPWYMQALTLCQIHGQMQDPRGTDSMEKAVWHGIGKMPLDQLVDWAQSVSLSLVKADRWNRVQQRRAQLLADGLLSDDLIIPQPPEQLHWNTVRIEGVKVRHLYQYERSVQKKVQKSEWNAFDAALAYVDLIEACEHPAQIALAALAVASWFLRAIREAIDEESKQTLSARESIQAKNIPAPRLRLLYALKKAVYFWSDQAHRVAMMFLHPGMRLHVSQQAFRYTMVASLLTGCSETTDVEAIASYFRLSVNLGVMCPVTDSPSAVRVSEAVTLHVLTRDLQCSFLVELQLIRPDILLPLLKPSQLNYQLFENDLLGFCPLECSVREVAMDTLLSDEGWKWEQVNSLMTSPLIPHQPSGWLEPGPRPLREPVQSNGFAEILGIMVSKEDFEIKLLARSATEKEHGLVSYADVAEALQTYSDKFQHGAVFSLDQPDANKRFHPFQKMTYSPESLQGTETLHTLFHTDYLLKQFSMGVEVCATPPFKLRRSKLTTKLPPVLQEALKPVQDRIGKPSKSHVHRFWIQATEIEYDERETDASILYLVGKVKFAVRCRPMLPNSEGELQDIEDDDSETAEKQFADDFTNNYNDIGQHYPEFLRLGELSKLRFLAACLHNLKEHLDRQINEPVNIESQVFTKCRSEMERQVEKDVQEILNDIKCQLKKSPFAPKFELQRQVQQALQGVVSKNSVSSYLSSQLVNSWVEECSSGGSTRISGLWGFPKPHELLLKSAMVSAITPSLEHIRTQFEAGIRAERRKRRSSFSSNLQQIQTSAQRVHTTAESCVWVPAAVMHSAIKGTVHTSTRLVYGGVLLCPVPRSVPSLGTPNRTSYIYSLNSRTFSTARSSRKSSLPPTFKLMGTSVEYRPVRLWPFRKTVALHDNDGEDNDLSCGSDGETGDVKGGNGGDYTGGDGGNSFRGNGGDSPRRNGKETTKGTAQRTFVVFRTYTAAEVLPTEILNPVQDGRLGDKKASRMSASKFGLVLSGDGGAFLHRRSSSELFQEVHPNADDRWMDLARRDVVYVPPNFPLIVQLNPDRMQPALKPSQDTVERFAHVFIPHSVVKCLIKMRDAGAGRNGVQIERMWYSAIDLIHKFLVQHPRETHRSARLQHDLLTLIVATQRSEKPSLTEGNHTQTALAAIVTHRAHNDSGSITVENFVVEGHCYVAIFNSQPFGEGHFCEAYRGTLYGEGPRNHEQCVIKFFKRGYFRKDMRKRKLVSRRASEYATTWNANHPEGPLVCFTDPELGRMDRKTATKFVGTFPFNIPKVPKEGAHYILEPFLEGRYKKLNDCVGRYENVEPEDMQFAMEFSLHVWNESEGHELLCDLQGVRNDEFLKDGKKIIKYKLTDPLIHSLDRLYGEGDNGGKGMEEFLAHVWGVQMPLPFPRQKNSQPSPRQNKGCRLSCQ